MSRPICTYNRLGGREGRGSCQATAVSDAMLMTYLGPWHCRDWHRRQRWDGTVSFDFLGYAFRPRDTMGKNGRFTGFDLAVSPEAVKRMNKIVSGGTSAVSRTSLGNSSRR